MNITPNTDLKVLHNVPLDNTYEHTIYFGAQGQSATLTAQSTYFASKTKYTFGNMTYQRVFDNKIRIEKNADDLYDCNYLMFRNTNFGTKWFYAFINKITYINNAVSEIEYELDVMQTWYNEYTIDDCYVERMHSTTDAVGDNLIPETIVPSVYVTHAEKAFPITKATGSAQDGTYTRKAIIIASDNPTTPIAGGITMDSESVVNGVPTNVLYKVIDMDNDVATYDAIMNAYRIGPDGAVLAIYAIPPFLNGIIMDTTSLFIPYELTNFVGGTFDGYTPKNNKMYTYPYNKLEVSNSFGQVKEYRFDLFAVDQTAQAIMFSGKATALPRPSFFIYPSNYAGSTINTDDCLSIGEYPEGAMSGDSFMMWLHEGALDSIASLTSGLIRTMATDEIGSMIGIGQTANAVTHGIANGFKAALAADHMYGNIKCSSALYGVDSGFAFKFKTKRCIRAQAKMMDDYFTKYGYAQMQIMKPNLHARAHWTYVKTQACTITGTIPADDQSKIESIYNKGTTFWANANEIGNYSLTNSVLV